MGPSPVESGLPEDRIDAAHELACAVWGYIESELDLDPEVYTPATVAFALAFLGGQFAATQEHEFSEGELREQFRRMAEISIKVYANLRQTQLQGKNGYDGRSS